jgi:hypothetical protein
MTEELRQGPKDHGLPDGETEHESGYLKGRRRALVGVLRYCARELGYEEPEAKVVKLLAEREETITALRKVCAAHGDNNFDDAAYIPDVVEKYLARYLDDGAIEDEPIADPAKRALAVAEQLRLRGIWADVHSGSPLDVRVPIREGLGFRRVFHGNNCPDKGPSAIADGVQREEARLAKAWAERAETGDSRG